MTNPSASSALGKFIWYDQMSNDLQGAEAFYTKVVGWTLAPNTMNDQRYTLLKAGERMVGGLMPIPAEAKGAQPAWMGYIAVDDVQAYADKVKAAGGMIHRPPAQIPNVGTFAVAADPDGAGFLLFKREQQRGHAAAAAGRRARPYRLARVARRRPGKRVRLLLRPVRLDEERRDGHGPHGQLPDLHHQGPADGRHDDEDGPEAGGPLGLLHQRRGDRRGRGAGQVAQAARSSTGRWRFPAEAGSSTGSIRKARCSRSSRRSADWKRASLWARPAVHHSRRSSS